MSKFNIVIFIMLSFVCHQQGFAQFEVGYAVRLLLGESTNEQDNYPRADIVSKNTRHGISYSAKYLVVYFLTPSSGDIALHVEGSYTAPKETKIISAKFKADDGSIILILLSNGNIVTLKYDQSAFPRVWKEGKTNIPTANFANAQKIIGDALYILKHGKVYASWDTAKTWAIDSINIGKLYVSDISIDTNYYAWIATDQGIFYQHPDSNIWRKTAPLPASFQNAYSIFVDRKNRIFVSRPLQVLVSTDRGSSWTDISTGTTQTITSFGDDAFGNIYGVGYDKAFRLPNGTPPWISIGDSINTQAYLPSNAKIINSIKGDTTLFAATIYGIFQSTDFGATWIHSPNNSQLQAHNFYTGVVKAGNYYFISTNLGIYRVAAGDTAWGKVFPKKGFVWGVNVLISDSAGNVYGNLPLKTGPSSWLFYTVKSTDHGDTWIPDTAGQKAVGINAGTQQFDYFVTKQGDQYLGGSGVLYSKKPGQPWKRDTAGIGLKSGEYIADVSLDNKKGIVYVGRRTGSFPSYSFALYKRGANDSVWQTVNTAPLAASEARLYSDADGNIIVRVIGGSYKIWKYDGSSWTEIPLPTGIGTSPWALQLAPARNGVLWGAFVGSNVNKGIYFTTNSGTSWKYVGLEAVGIKFLNTIEDTAYAVTFIDGVHAFTTASEPTSVENIKPQIAKSYELYQNYPNPFNPSTTIRFSIPVSGFVSIKVFDILGREVAALLNEEKKEGIYSVPFNGAKLSSGVYFYRMQADNFTQVKKLLLQK